MALPDNILAELKQEKKSKFHIQLLEDTKELVEMSREKMEQYYGEWDKNQETFRSIVTPDKEDKLAREKKEPEKMVVPTAFSQVLTFTAFCYALYTQREKVFELVGVSEEDHDAAKIGEAVLQRDLGHNNFPAKLMQLMLDIARFSIGVVEVSWVEERRRMVQKIQGGFLKKLFGTVLGGMETEEEVDKVVYQGNKLNVISPYHFFPDVRLPMVRFHEGEFVATEDEFSYSSLKQLEHEEVVAGVDYVKVLSRDVLKERHGDTKLSFDISRVGHNISHDVGQSKHPILVTKVQRNIIPKQYKIGDTTLGEEDYPVKYIVWYANDDRIIKAEKLDYPHGRYTYEVAQFIPDQTDFLGMSFSESINQLQSVITWFINSHITSVRKVISNFLIVDPSGVEMDDLAKRNPIIRLKPVASNRGIERYIQQLQVQDVTAKHLQDIEVLRGLVQETTGVNDNLLGQFYTGRRSATEARNVTSAAAGRLKMIASQIWASLFQPMGDQMLQNLRHGLDEEAIVRVVGLQRALVGASFKKVNKEDLSGDYDFEIFDGTLPSEKHFVAEALQEVLMALIAKPEAAIALQLDPRKMLLEALELRGVRNPERFSLPALPEQNNNGGLEQALPTGAAPGLPGATGQPVLPGGNGGLPARAPTMPVPSAGQPPR